MGFRHPGEAGLQDRRSAALRGKQQGVAPSRDRASEGSLPIEDDKSTRRGGGQLEIPQEHQGGVAVVLQRPDPPFCGPVWSIDFIFDSNQDLLGLWGRRGDLHIGH